MTDAKLKELKELAEKATPGPWYFNNPDDSACMNVICVTTQPEQLDDGQAEWDCVAMTLLQSDGRVNHPDKRWFDNAEFIAAANPQTVLELLAEIERLKARYELAVSQEPDID